MISQFFRKVFSNRYLSIAAVTISTTACLPVVANAIPVKLQGNSAVTFDFKRCFSRESDVICQGILRSNSGEQSITIERNRFTATSITDSNGRSYIADKIFVGDFYLCAEPNVELSMKLVEGVDYKTAFLFSNASLSSGRIPLLEIGGIDFKVRNINLQNINSPSNPSPQPVSNNGSGQRNSSSGFSPYRSGPEQIVLAGLNPGAGYYIQGYLFNGYEHSKRVRANACGEILIGGTSKIRSLSISGRMIDIANLPQRNRERCGS